MKKLKKNENSKSWNTYYELAGSCACGICSCSCTSTSDASLTGMRSKPINEASYRSSINAMWKYAYTMPRIIMTHTGYYINSDDKKEIYIKESESQIENLYEEIQGENRLTKFYKNSRKDIQKMGRSIIRELQENLG